MNDLRLWQQQQEQQRTAEVQTDDNAPSCQTAKLTHQGLGVKLSQLCDMTKEHCAKILGKGDILISDCNQSCDLLGVAHYLLHLSMIN